MVDDKEWHRIGDELTGMFHICGCQRKLKSIVDNLYSIYEKCNGAYKGTHKRDFTGAEWLLIALIEAHFQGNITHGINCEYPIIIEEGTLWKWVLKEKDNPNLEDN